MKKNYGFVKIKKNKHKTSFITQNINRVNEQIHNK